MKRYIIFLKNDTFVVVFCFPIYIARSPGRLRMGMEGIGWYGAGRNVKLDLLRWAH
jgi:hypothetical protein